VLGITYGRHSTLERVTNVHCCRSLRAIISVFLHAHPILKPNAVFDVSRITIGSSFRRGYNPNFTIYDHYLFKYIYELSMG